MPGNVDDPTAPGNVLELRHALTVPLPEAAEAGEPVSVTVVGADAQARSRVLELLAGTPGLRVVGWAESVMDLDVLDQTSQVLVSVEPERERHRGDEGAVAGGEPRRPELSARQRQVLVAYASGNELLDVVARRLGMGPETLKTHLRRIRAKYESVGRHAPTRRDLYARAIEDGLISLTR